MRLLFKPSYLSYNPPKTAWRQLAGKYLYSVAAAPVPQDQPWIDVPAFAKAVVLAASEVGCSINVWPSAVELVPCIVAVMTPDPATVIPAARYFVPEALQPAAFASAGKAPLDWINSATPVLQALNAVITSVIFARVV